jgi:bacillolysin
MNSPLYDKKEYDIHTNAGVSNKAAYLITDGDTFNGHTIRGIGQNKAQQLYYHVTKYMLTSTSDYADLGSALNAACHTLIGKHSISADDCTQVQKAVSATEMLRLPDQSPAPQAYSCIGDLPVQTIFFDDMENTASGNWQSQALHGSNTWFYPSFPNQYNIKYPRYYTISGSEALWGYANAIQTSDYVIRTSKAIQIPPQAYLHFHHSYVFETKLGTNGQANQYYDGGILEYSIDGGQTWQDAENLASENGYNGQINGADKAGKSNNILYNRAAFVGQSPGYISSRYDLSLLSGKQALFRFHIAVDESISDYGWLIDDFRVYTCDTSSLSHKVYTPVIYR